MHRGPRPEHRRGDLPAVSIVRLGDEDRVLIIDLRRAGKVRPADNMTRALIRWASLVQWTEVPQHFKR